MIIHAKIKFSKTFKIIKHKSHWEIHLTERPENNRANIQLLKELRKQCRSVKLLRGRSSKSKLIEMNL